MSDRLLDIRAFDYLRGYHQIESEVSHAIERVLRSGQLILGPEGDAFEHEFAHYTGSAYAVAVGSGTDALILALMAVGVGPGDEVITVANTAVPTVSAIRATGAVPRFVDIDPHTMLMDISQVEQLISPATRCLLPVHLYGLAVPSESLNLIAQRHGLRVIEDCAHAHGATENGRHVGVACDVGCFSFYPTKNLGAFGDGGICLTQDRSLAERIRSLRMYGFRRTRIAEEDGRNSRLDEVQAAVLRIKLRYLDNAVSRRRAIARRYICELGEASEFAESGWVLPDIQVNDRHAYHQFVIRVPDRTAVIQELTDQGVGYGIHYSPPVHHMPAFSGFHSGLALSKTDKAASEILSLPMYPELTDEEISEVINVLRKAMHR